MAKKKEHDPMAVELGRRGGLARAKSLNADQRTKAARLAVMARWKKAKAAKEGK